MNFWHTPERTTMSTNYYRSRVARDWSDPNRPHLKRRVLEVGDCVKQLGYVGTKKLTMVVNGDRAGHQIILHDRELVHMSPLELLALQADD